MNRFSNELLARLSPLAERLWCRLLSEAVMSTKPRRVPLLWGLIFGLLLRAAPAFADDETATAAARERFKEGVAYFDQKQYEKARAAFVQAYALKKHPAVLLNLAQSELRSDHERDAAQHFSEYLRDATDASAGERDAAQSGLAAAKAALLELDVTADADAELLVDGASQGTAPLPSPIFVEPGTHTVQAKKGERVASQTVSGKAGEAKELKLHLANEAGAVATPATKPAPAPEASSSEAEEPQPEEPKAASGDREPFFHWLVTKPAGLISGGATILLGGGAVGFAIAANVSYKNADDIARQIDDRTRLDGVPSQGICSDPAQALSGLGSGADDEAAAFVNACKHRRQAVKRGDSEKKIATIAGIGAGVMAVTTVVLYFVTAEHEPASGEASAFRVLPWFTPGNSGLAVSGSF
jgi:hypothetical protein